MKKPLTLIFLNLLFIFSCQKGDLQDFTLVNDGLTTQAWIKGAVFDSTNGSRLMGVEFYIDSELKDTSNPNGDYCFSVTSLNFTLTCRMTKYKEFTTNLSLQKGITNQVDIYLDQEQNIWINGNVFNSATSQPVVLAEIIFTNIIQTHSGSNGSFQFFINDTTPRLTFRKTGYNTLITNLSYNNNTTNQLNITLEPTTYSEMTIVSYNVEDFSAQNAYQEVAQLVSTSNVDLIVFQEIQPEDQASFTQALLDAGVSMEYVGYSSTGGYGDDYLAYWSRWPVDMESSMFIGTLTDPVSGCYYDFGSMRPVFRFRVDYGGVYIWCYSAHLKAQVNCDTGTGCWEDSCIKRRRAQASALESYIKANHNEYAEYIAVIGDMNTALATDFNDDQTLGMLTLKTDNPVNTSNDFIAVNYSLIPGEPTNPGWGSLLDHIILSPALFAEYVSGSVSVPHPAGDPSDHYPVMLKVSFQ